MPRDASGTYSLPLPAVVDGNVIEASYENTTSGDMGNEFTDSLSRSGKGAMLSALRLIDGTVSSPGQSFASEANSGVYRAGPGDVRYSLLGNDVFRFISTGPQVWDGAQWNDVVYAGGPNSVSLGTADGQTLRWEASTSSWDSSSSILIDDLGNSLFSNDVGIRNTNPSDYNNAANDLVVGGAGGTRGITIATSTTGIGSILFADGTGAGDNSRGQVIYNHATDSMSLYTNGLEAFVVNSSREIIIQDLAGVGTRDVQVDATGKLIAV